MSKLRLNPIFLTAILIAFLAVQWVSASAHIHLSQNHHHNNSKHEHQLQSHSHQLATHLQNSHADAIDTAHPSETSKTVDLDQACSTPHGYFKTNITAFVTPNFPLNFKMETCRFYLSNSHQHTPSYLNQSNVNPRAPPIYS